jgi:ATP-dependent Lon protease
LLKKQREVNGLKAENIEFSDKAILDIIRHYTREAGVRNLEREIASICRKSAVAVVKTDHNAHLKVSASSLSKYLGPPKFRYGMAETEPQIGMATGLAWTELGGELLGVEVTIVPGRSKITITGRLGEVMQESAQAALSYVRSRSEQLALPPTSTRRSTSTFTFPRAGFRRMGRPPGSRWQGAGVRAVPRAGA